MIQLKFKPKYVIFSIIFAMLTIYSYGHSETIDPRGYSILVPIIMGIMCIFNIIMLVTDLPKD